MRTRKSHFGSESVYASKKLYFRSVFHIKETRHGKSQHSRLAQLVVLLAPPVGTLGFGQRRRHLLLHSIHLLLHLDVLVLEVVVALLQTLQLLVRVSQPAAAKHTTIAVTSQFNGVERHDVCDV